MTPKARILAALDDLTNAEFQWRMWVLGEGPGISSLNETICQLYDDSSLADVIDSDKWIAFSSVAEESLRRLMYLLTQAARHQDIQALLQSALWRDVMDCAAESRQLVQASGSEQYVEVPRPRGT